MLLGKVTFLNSIVIQLLQIQKAEPKNRFKKITVRLK